MTPDNQERIRKTFLTGVLFTVPLVVTIYLVVVINGLTDQYITQPLFHHDIPFLGFVIALLVIYALGMLANSLVGRYLGHAIDHFLTHLPVFGQLYLAWKQVALTPGGTEGTFSRVVLIPDETKQMKWLGFTSGRICEGEEKMYCVFVPNSPNPITGRLYFVPVAKCVMLAMSVEDAFKLIISTGNYVPPLVSQAYAALHEPGNLTDYRA